MIITVEKMGGGGDCIELKTLTVGGGGDKRRFVHLYRESYVFDRNYRFETSGLKNNF